jgi:hypothetical protein
LSRSSKSGRTNQVQEYDADDNNRERWSSEIAVPGHDVDTRHKAGHAAESVVQTP